MFELAVPFLLGCYLGKVQRLSASNYELTFQEVVGSFLVLWLLYTLCALGTMVFAPAYGAMVMMFVGGVFLAWHSLLIPALQRRKVIEDIINEQLSK